MRKNDALKIVNVILAVLISTQMLSGFLGGSLPMQAFDIVHRGGAIILLLCILVHVVLNWTWIKSSYFKTKRTAQSS